MKKTYTFIFFILFLFPVFAQNQWIEQTNNNGLNKNYLYPDAISACDSQNAVIGGHYSRMFKTTNSGTSWSTINFSSIADTLQYVNDVFMFDKDNIWAVVNEKIIKSGDGGNTWNVQFFDTTLTKALNYIEMFDSSNGVAMGDALTTGNTSAVILKTADGGAHWNSVNTESFGGASGDVWRRIDFVNINTGYFFESGVNPQRLYKTTDGGAHWDTTNYSLAESYAMVLKFYNEDIGFAYNSGKIHFTTDGGQSWGTQIVNNQGWGMDINYFRNSKSFTVAMVIGGSIYFSADTGKTWSVDSTLLTQQKPIRDIAYPDSVHAWALTGGGMVQQVFYKKYDIVAGIDNQEINPVTFTLSQNYPNPFNPSTKIRYSLTQKEFVTIKIFDMLGREVKLLINREQSAGQHEINFNAAGLPSGIYFYRVAAGSSTIVKKMVLLK